MGCCSPYLLFVDKSIPHDLMSKLWRENRLYLELDSECLKTVLGPTTRLKVWEHQSPTSKDTLTITLCPSISELSDKSTVMTKHSSIMCTLSSHSHYRCSKGYIYPLFWMQYVQQTGTGGWLKLRHGSSEVGVAHFHPEKKFLAYCMQRQECGP